MLHRRTLKTVRAFMMKFMKKPSTWHSAVQCVCLGECEHARGFMIASITLEITVIQDQVCLPGLKPQFVSMWKLVYSP